MTALKRFVVHRIDDLVEDVIDYAEMVIMACSVWQMLRAGPLQGVDSEDHVD